MRKAGVIIVILLLSCCNTNKKLLIDENSIAYTWEGDVLKEMLLKELIKDDFHFWKIFWEEHPKLNPIFVVNTMFIEPFVSFTLREFSIEKIPAIQEQKFSIRYDNKLYSEKRVVIDSELNILYKGDPLRDSNFSSDIFFK